MGLLIWCLGKGWANSSDWVGYIVFGKWLGNSGDWKVVGVILVIEKWGGVIMFWEMVG